jgi:hypothetical protein
MPKQSDSFHCNCCDYTCSIKSNYTAHLKTEKHKRLEKMPNQPNTFTCDYCQYTCTKKSNFNIHLKTERHIRLENNRKQSVSNEPNVCSDNIQNEIHIQHDNNKQSINMPKQSDVFTCEYCQYTCHKKSNFNIHLQTEKHKRLENVHKKTQKPSLVDTNVNQSKLSGNKSQPIGENTTDNMDLYSMIHLLIKENQEIRNLVLTQHNTLTELVKNQQSSTNNSHNTNSHNNYNINMFLSEKCKDAQNMSDFIEVIKNKVDMFKIEENGYVNGISKLFIDELKSMEVTERPLHCTDERRNTFYVHNNDTWNKDEDLKDTKRAISHVSHANLRQCIDWSSNVPKSGSEREDHINRSIRLCKEAHKSGEDDKVEKIIRNISKEIPLNKQVISDVLV